MTTLALRAWLVRLEVAARQRVYRGLVSRLLVPFWPRAGLSELNVETLADEAAPVSAELAPAAPEALREPLSRLTGAVDRLACRRLSGRTIDVEPRSGAVFLNGKWVEEGDPRELLPTRRTHPDLTRFLRLRPMLREPVVVLHCGGDTSLDAFFADLLPRFFSLDALDLPRDLLVIVLVSMAMTDPFQDAINDGCFAPADRADAAAPRHTHRDGLSGRPSAVAARCLRTPVEADLGCLFARRIVSGTSRVSVRRRRGRRGAALCRVAADRGLARASRHRGDRPGRTVARQAGQATLGAPLVIGPDTGEVSACVLGGPGLGRVIEPRPGVGTLSATCWHPRSAVTTRCCRRRPPTGPGT
ncbi:MAG: hypothetical protein HPM95_00960 [Alphaproteobacteria bacterium]|nr:hypothetical protein [Alphaproteobacteria bacterium]